MMIERHLERVEMKGFHGTVILTDGAIVDGTKLYGVFATTEDACSDDADELAIGTVGRDQVTAEQVEMAERNSAAMLRWRSQ